MIQEPGYRLNVGLIIINDNGKLLLCKRKNMNSWQFPQGGIDAVSYTHLTLPTNREV